MHLKYYTADAICQAMGLPGFVEESWTQRDGPTLRLLLKPSLHPELCLTLFREKESTRLSVVALSESFWTQVAASHAEAAAEEAAHVVHTLTEEEKAARVRALKSAVQADAEARRRYEDDVRRRFESEEGRGRFESEEGRGRLESEQGRWIAPTEKEKTARALALMMSAIPAVTEARRRYESEVAHFWTQVVAAHLVRTMTEKEIAARVRALKRAVPTDTETRRRFESEQGRWIEEVVHRIEEESRRIDEAVHRIEEEARRPEEQAHEVATRPKKAQHLFPSEREEVLLPSSAFDEVARLFSEARAAFGPRDIGLDGMGSESCLVSRAGVHRLDARVSGVAMVDYVGKVIALAWSSCCRPRVCKALAEAAGYIDMNTDYALKEVGQQCSAARKRSRRIEAKTLRKLKAKALRELKRLRTRHS